MQSAKDIAASAKAGMEKTKATLQEKAEKLTTRDPLKKEMATEKKEEKIHEAERQKHEERRDSAATGHTGTGGGILGHHSTTTGTGPGSGGEYPTAAVEGEGEYPVGQQQGTGRVGRGGQDMDPALRTS